MNSFLKSCFTHFRNYIKTHIGFSVTLSVMLLLLMAMLILQAYVKNQYFTYILEETDRTERAVLDAASANINNTLQGIVETGCSIAVNSSFRETVDTVLEAEGTAERSSLLMKDILSLMTHYSNNIAAVTVVTEDGILQEYGRYWDCAGYSNIWTDENLEILDELYQNVMTILKNPAAKKYCVSEEPSEHVSLPNVLFFHLALPLLGTKSNWNQVSAVVVVTFRMDAVVNEGTLTGFLTGEDGRIIYHEDRSLTGLSLEEYKSLWPENEDISQNLDYFGWTAHIMIDVEGIHERVNQMYRGSILVYVLLLFVCGIIWQLALRGILKPVGCIREAMKEIRLGGERKKIKINGSHEIWQLAQDYNSMLDALYQQQEILDRHYKEKTLSIKQKNKAEWEALESQINAHFLCNTLTAINYNAIENEDYEVAALLKKLSNMLSYSFSRRTTAITLGQGIKWVEEYLYLQKFRLMEVFDYQIDFPMEYSEWPSCKCFLQPFVENSILHGFEGREKDGRILISGCPEGNRFKICISDNGCGMEPEISREIQKILGETHMLELKGCGIGIRNAVTRLRMYYGDKLTILLETAPGEGCCFTFWLPLVGKPEGERSDDRSISL